MAQQWCRLTRVEVSPRSPSLLEAILRSTRRMILPAAVGRGAARQFQLGNLGPIHSQHGSVGRGQDSGAARSSSHSRSQRSAAQRSRPAAASPERVLGRPGAQWMTSGVAIGPMALRTCGGECHHVPAEHAATDWRRIHGQRVHMHWCALTRQLHALMPAQA